MYHFSVQQAELKLAKNQKLAQRYLLLSYQNSIFNPLRSVNVVTDRTTTIINTAKNYVQMQIYNNQEQPNPLYKIDYISLNGKVL